MDLSMPAGTPAPPPLERLTTLYAAGGYGRQSAQLATDLLADHDAGKDTRGAVQPPAGASTLGSDVLDLLAAIRDALDVPLADLTDADQRAYQAVMRRRLSEVHIVLDVALEPKWIGTFDPAREAASIRTRTADTPVTYATWQSETAHGGGQA